MMSDLRVDELQGERYKGCMPQDQRIGTRLGGYQIEALLGRGGMGVVYLAEHLRLRRKVALKVLVPEFADDEDFRTRFMRESQVAASIDHPNVIPIYEADEADGLLYLAMRYVEGPTLKALLKRRGALDINLILEVITQTGRALDAAHGRSLVHRDVKPTNILLAAEPDAENPLHIYLTDFGLTKRTSTQLALTNSGQFLGTLDYAAPEQIGGKAVDARTDIYALGCLLYECLTGQVPYTRESDVALMWAHLIEPAPRAHAVNPLVPPEADAIIAKAMAKPMDDRYPTCRALVTALRTACSSNATSEVMDSTGSTRPTRSPVSADTIERPSSPLGHPPAPEQPQQPLPIPAEDTPPKLRVTPPVEVPTPAPGAAPATTDEAPPFPDHLEVPPEQRTRRWTARPFAIAAALIPLIGLVAAGIWIAQRTPERPAGSAPTAASTSPPTTAKPTTTMAHDTGSTTASRAFPTAHEKQILGRIPAGIRPNCDRAAKLLPGAIAGVLCTGNNQPSIQYNLYPSKTAMYRQFNARVKGAGAHAGPCNTTSRLAHLAAHIHHERTVGKLLCYYAAGQVRLEWTTDPLTVYAFSFTRSISRHDLYHRVYQRAGPDTHPRG
jgi:serine/threonine protein kinase